MVTGIRGRVPRAPSTRSARNRLSYFLLKCFNLNITGHFPADFGGKEVPESACHQFFLCIGGGILTFFLLSFPESYVLKSA